MTTKNWTEAARSGAPMPGRNGDKLRLILKEVDDPIRVGQTTVAVSRRPGGIEAMRSKGSLTEAQQSAADGFRALWETAHSDGMKGIDYLKVYVDGGRQDGLHGADRRLNAHRGLERVSRELGASAFEVLVLAAGMELDMAAVASELACTKSTACSRVKRALEALSALWGAVGTGTRVRAETGPATQRLVEMKPIERGDEHVALAEAARASLREIRRR